MEKLSVSLFQLYLVREKMEELEMFNDPHYQSVCEKISQREKLLENTSATGGPSVGGMGAVVNAQPSGLAGQTIGTSWASGGGQAGSGDISFGYNPSGSSRMQQKIPVMGSNHGARTGKKSRQKKLNMKALKDIFAKRQDYTAGEGDTDKKEKKSRVMDFNDFLKNDFTTIKKWKNSQK